MKRRGGGWVEVDILSSVVCRDVIVRAFGLRLRGNGSVSSYSQYAAVVSEVEVKSSVN